jgi:hypothetical protein
MDEMPNTKPPALPARPLAPRRIDWLGLAVVHAALFLVAAWSYVADPAQDGGFLPCIWHRWTGLYCPGCGGQRALHALLHGDVLGAMSLNLMAVVAVGPLICYAYVSYMVQAFKGRRMPQINSWRWGWVVLALFALAFALGRNIAHPVGVWLAP